MIPSNLPKNVVLAETREREEDEDESLKDLYQELDLKNLTLVAIDSRSPGFYKKIPKCKII